MHYFLIRHLNILSLAALLLFFPNLSQADGLFGLLGSKDSDNVYRKPFETVLSPKARLAGKDFVPIVNQPSDSLLSYLSKNGVPIPGGVGYEDEVLLTWFQETGDGTGFGTISLKIDPKDFSLLGLVQRFKKEAYYKQVLEYPLFSVQDVRKGIVLNRNPFVGDFVTMQIKEVSNSPAEKVIDPEAKRISVDQCVTLSFKHKEDSMSSDSWDENKLLLSFVQSDNPKLRSTWELRNKETGLPVRKIVLHSWRGIASGGVEKVEFMPKDSV